MMVSDSVTMCVPLQLVAATLKCTASLDVGVPDSLMMLFEVVASIQPGALLMPMVMGRSPENTTAPSHTTPSCKSGNDAPPNATGSHGHSSSQQV